MSEKNRWLKSISYVLTIAMSVSITSDASYGFMSQIKTSIPIGLSDAGRVIERYDAKGNSPLIYVIQSLHCHAGVQKNISKIIGKLKEKHGNNLSAIGMEGSIGKIDTSSFENISYKGIREKLVEYFTEKGELQGAEIYALLNPKQVELYGIEDENVYWQNFGQLYGSILKHDQMTEMLSDIDKTIKRGKEILYTKSLRKFEDIVNQYKHGEIRFDEYLTILTRYVKERKWQKEYSEITKQIKTFEMTKNLQQKQVMWEARQVVKQLAGYLSNDEKNILKTIQRTEEYYTYLEKILKQKNVMYGTYRNLTQYLSYLEQKKQINEVRLFVELDEMKYEIAKSLARGKHPRMLVYCDEYRGLLEKYTGNCVSIYEKEKWEKGKDEFYRVTNEMTSKLRVKNVFENIETDLKEMENGMENFYQTADKRNEIMVRQMLKHLQTTDIKKSPHPPLVRGARGDKKKSPVSIMVIGGYHTRGVTEILRSKGISYEVIMPNVNGNYDRGLYEKKVMEQAGNKYYQENNTYNRKRVPTSIELVSTVGIGALDGLSEGINKITQMYGNIEDIQIFDEKEDIRIEYSLGRRGKILQIYNKKQGRYRKISEVIEETKQPVAIGKVIEQLKASSEDMFLLFLDRKDVIRFDRLQKTKKRENHTIIQYLNKLMQTSSGFAIDRGFLQIAHGLAGRGQGQSTGMSHDSLEEKERLVIDPLIGKIRQRSERYWSDNKKFLEETEKLYVELQGKKSKQDFVRFSLEQKIADFLSLENEKKALLLSGEAGGGKSLFCEFLEKRLWEERENGRSEIIPVFITLSSLKDPVRDAIGETFENMGIERSQLSEMKRKYQFLFIFDGYDELKEKHRQNLYESNRISEWAKSKTIVTCRESYLPRSIETHFAPKRDGRTIEKIYIAPFDPTQSKKYLEAYVQEYKGWDLEKYLEYIKKIPGLSKLSETPFLLKLIAEELPKIVARHEEKERDTELEITRTKLLESFIDTWFEREIEEKLKPSGRLTEEDPKDLFWHYAEKLAGSMSSDEKLEFSYFKEKRGTKLKSYWHQVFKDEAEYPRHYDDICFHALPKRRLRDKNYAFWHATLRDFFAHRGDEKADNIELEKKSSLKEKIKTLQDRGIKKWEEKSEREQELYDEKLYVPLKASYLYRSDARFKLHDKMQQLLEKKDKDVVLLFGDAGSGKTFYTRKLEYELWVKHRRAETDVIPLFISLTSLQNYRERAIEETLEKHGFNDEEIKELQKEHKFVFILDGYDELQEYPNLYTTNKMDKWNGQVIITSRSDYFKRDHRPYLYPYKEGKIETELVEELYIGLFSERQRKEYIQKYIENKKLSWEAKNYEQHISRIGGLHQLAETPFGWRLILEVLPDIVEKHDELDNIGINKVYDTFIDQWFEREIEKYERKEKRKLEYEEREDKKKAFRKFCERLASKMTSKGISEIFYQKERGRANEWDEFFGSEDENVRWCLHAAPLIMERGKKGSRWKFLHKTLQEYFANDEIVKVMEKEKKGKLHRNSILVKRMNERLESESMIQFRVDSVHEKEWFKDAMWQIIELSKTDASICTAAANAITILNAARVSFSGRDLSRIRIPGADLTGGLFDDTDFRSADLRNVKFVQAFLRKAKFDKANMRLVKFGERAYLKGHIEGITSLTYSPDGNTIATGSYDKIVRLWNLKTCKEIAKFKKHISNVTSVTFSPIVSILASGSDDRTVILWDIKNGKELAVLRGHTHSVSSVRYNPDGKILATGSWDKTVRLWNSKTGEHIDTLKGHTGSIESIAFSPIVSILASGSDDKTVILWDIKNSKQLATLKGHIKRVTSVVFSPCGKILATGSWDKTVRLWRVEDGKELAVLRGHTEKVTSVVFSPDGKILATGSEDKTVRLWGINTQKHIFTLNEYIDGIGNVSSFLSQVPEKLWDIRTGKELDILKEYVKGVGVTSLTYSPDGGTMITGGWDKTVRLWRAGDGKELAVLRGHTQLITSVTYVLDGRALITGSEDKTVKVWDLTRLKEGKEPILVRNETECPELFLEEARIQDVQGLSEDNRLLLQQRGAFGIPLRFYKEIPILIKIRNDISEKLYEDVCEEIDEYNKEEREQILQLLLPKIAKINLAESKKIEEESKESDGERINLYPALLYLKQKLSGEEYDAVLREIETKQEQILSSYPLLQELERVMEERESIHVFQQYKFDEKKDGTRDKDILLPLRIGNSLDRLEQEQKRIIHRISALEKILKKINHFLEKTNNREKTMLLLCSIITLLYVVLCIWPTTGWILASIGVLGFISTLVWFGKDKDNKLYVANILFLLVMSIFFGYVIFGVMSVMGTAGMVTLSVQTLGIFGIVVMTLELLFACYGFYLDYKKKIKTPSSATVAVLVTGYVLVTITTLCWTLVFISEMSIGGWLAIPMIIGFLGILMTSAGLIMWRSDVKKKRNEKRARNLSSFSIFSLFLGSTFTLGAIISWSFIAIMGLSGSWFTIPIISLSIGILFLISGFIKWKWYTDPTREGYIRAFTEESIELEEEELDEKSHLFGEDSSESEDENEDLGLVEKALRRLEKAKYKMTRTGLQDLQKDIDLSRERDEIFNFEDKSFSSLRQKLQQQRRRIFIHQWEYEQYEYKEYQYKDGTLVLMQYKKGSKEPIDIQLLKSPVIDIEIMEKISGGNPLIRLLRKTRLEMNDYMKYIREVLTAIYDPDKKLGYIYNILRKYYRIPQKIKYAKIYIEKRLKRKDQKEPCISAMRSMCCAV